jgi:hypothetical protein
MGWLLVADVYRRGYFSSTTKKSLHWIHGSEQQQKMIIAAMHEHSFTQDWHVLFQSHGKEHSLS